MALCILCIYACYTFRLNKKMMPEVRRLPTQALSMDSFLKNLFKQTCTLILLLTVAINSSGQSIDYKVHANIVYRFTKYIQWPENKRGGDFVIGIVGDSPLYDELNALTANKFVGNQKIVIKRIPSSAASINCEILFISEDESGSLKKIAIRTAGNPILLVSEEDGLAFKGSCINFIIVSDHLKLEINENNIEQRKLSIASELLQLGKIVK